MVVYKNLIIGLEPSRKIVDMRNSINISHNLKNAPNQWAQIMAEIIDKVDLLAKSLKLVRADAIDIDMEGQSALRIEVDKVREKTSIDFIHPRVLRLAETKNRNRIGFLIN